MQQRHDHLRLERDRAVIDVRQRTVFRDAERRSERGPIERPPNETTREMGHPGVTREAADEDAGGDRSYRPHRTFHPCDLERCGHPRVLLQSGEACLGDLREGFVVRLVRLRKIRDDLAVGVLQPREEIFAEHDLEAPRSEIEGAGASFFESQRRNESIGELVCGEPREYAIASIRSRAAALNAGNFDFSASRLMLISAASVPMLRMRRAQPELGRSHSHPAKPSRAP